MSGDSFFNTLQNFVDVVLILFAKVQVLLVVWVAEFEELEHALALVLVFNLRGQLNVRIPHLVLHDWSFWDWLLNCLLIRLHHKRLTTRLHYRQLLRWRLSNLVRSVLVVCLHELSLLCVRIWLVRLVLLVLVVARYDLLGCTLWLLLDIRDSNWLLVNLGWSLSWSLS